MSASERAFAMLTERAGEGVVVGQMFGKPCLKVNGKAFAARQGDVLAFKLPVDVRTGALEHPGAALWDPSGANRPMKEWVAIPAAGLDTDLTRLAGSARAYVESQQ